MTARERAEQAMVFGGDRNPMIDKITAAIETAVLEEREACAKIAESIDPFLRRIQDVIAYYIRERGKSNG